MQNKILVAVYVLCLTTITSCSQNNIVVENDKAENSTEKVKSTKKEQHNYGGYYCPDNLTNFPAVDITNWKSVPVVNERMATKEETQNGASLIFVDLEKYPDAKPLDLRMPKLAQYHNRSSNKKEIIIVIQALNISNDAIVGFRFLNGGNGSARLDEIKLLSDKEIENISPSHFFTQTLKINAPKSKIWDVLTKTEYSKSLQTVFDKNNKLKADWNIASKVNFKYHNTGHITSEFAGNLYGNMYIQIDYELRNQYIQVDSELGNGQYVEKFFVTENQETGNSELIIVCGPYADDFKKQQTILKNWAQEVKHLSEKK